MNEINWDDIPKQPPIEWSTGAWNGPLITLDPDDPFGDMERIFNRGIHVTSITPPEQGWPIAMYCPICKETTFVLSPWAIKPEDGGYWRMNDICVDETLGFKHNMQLGMEGYHVPIDLKSGGINFQLSDPLPPEDLSSMVEFTQEMPIEEAKRRWPNTTVTGEETTNGN